MFVLLVTRLLREWESLTRKLINHTSCVGVVTPTDRPKSVRNRCVIEICGSLFSQNSKLQKSLHANKDTWSSGHLIMSHLATCMYSMFRQISSNLCHISWLWILNIPRFFLEAVMFLDFQRISFTFLIWLDLLGSALVFRISILKYSNYFQTTNTDLQTSQASENIWKVLQVILWPVV